MKVTSRQALPLPGKHDFSSQSRVLDAKSPADAGLSPFMRVLIGRTALLTIYPVRGRFFTQFPQRLYLSLGPSSPDAILVERTKSPSIAGPHPVLSRGERAVRRFGGPKHHGYVNRYKYLVNFII